MDKLGLIFAMKEEIEEALKYFDVLKEYNLFDLKIYECFYNNKNFILTECGIGKVNAARCAQILIDNLKVDAIINIGVAGGIDESLNIGDIVIGKSLVQHDFDLTAFGRKKGDIPSVGQYIYSDEYLLKKASNIKLDAKIKIGTIASGDIFVSDINISKKINTKFNALCTEMEGASIAQTCYLANIPFLVIRSISDIPNNNNNIDFDKFLIDSSKKIAIFLIKLLDEIIKEDI